MRQPAFVALLEAREARYAECEWEAAAIREATLDAGEAAGVEALGKAQAPVRLAVTGRTVGPAPVRVAGAAGPPAHPGPPGRRPGQSAWPRTGRREPVASSEAEAR